MTHIQSLSLFPWAPDDCPILLQPVQQDSLPADDEETLYSMEALMAAKDCQGILDFRKHLLDICMSKMVW